MKEAEQQYDYYLKEYEICQQKVSASQSRFWHILLGLLGLSITGIFILKDISISPKNISIIVVIACMSIIISVCCLLILRRERFFLRCSYFRLQHIEKVFYPDGGINCLIDNLDKMKREKTSSESNAINKLFKYTKSTRDSFIYIEWMTYSIIFFWISIIVFLFIS
jgi:hypothetical protein